MYALRSIFSSVQQNEQAETQHTTLLHYHTQFQSHNAAKSLPLPLFARLFIFFIFSLRFYYMPDNLLPDFSMHATQNTHSSNYTCQKITTETTMKFIALDSHTQHTPLTLKSSCQSVKIFYVDRFDIAHTQLNISACL